MLPSNMRSYLGRYRQIATVLIGHGLGDLIGILGLQRFASLHWRLLGRSGRAEERPTRPERVRMALEELGVTFIKLGQVLSSRGDLLPQEYQAELVKLQDAAPPIPVEMVRELVAAELGQPIEEVFFTFDPTPLAAASIGQAHAATLRDGTEVVIKVRRPDAVDQVETDLRILHSLANAASRRWDLASQYDVVGLTHEFSQTLRSELDYLREARNIERIAANFADSPDLHIPKVFWQTTTSSLLTLERIRGIKINDLEALNQAGIDRSALAQRLSETVLKMVFEDGFFHADPHPGNFFVEPAGKLGLIDFGMVGVIDRRTQEQLIDLFVAVTRQDMDQLVDALMDLGVTSQRVNSDLLRADISRLFYQYYDRPMEEIGLTALLNEVLSIARRHYLRLPSNLALLIKTLMMVEGIAKQLDPALNQTAVIIPYARHLMRQRLSPRRVARRLGESSLDLAWLSIELPRRLRRLISQVERGQLEVRIRPSGFDEIIRRLDRLANRIVLGIIVAAMIIGLAILLATYNPLGWVGLQAIMFFIGVISTAVIGAYLAWRVFRSGRG